MPDKIINYILEEKEISKKWFTKLLGTFTPEETFFQTLTMKSDLKDLVEINPIDMIGQNCKTWAYFFDEDKPFKGHPYIFTENEYDKLIKKIVGLLENLIFLYQKISWNYWINI